MHWLDLYIETETNYVPDKELFDKWISITLGGQNVQMSIKVVTPKVIQQLNKDFRQIDKVTDVLSFTAEQLLEEDSMPYIGDIAMCAEEINADADQLKVEKSNHWAHITIHSILHLLGYDHQLEEDNKEMQNLESQIMADLKLHDPWALN